MEGIEVMQALLSLTNILYASPLYILLSRIKEAKEWKELLCQDQLEAMISFLESLGDERMEKAKEYLQLIEKSSYPEHQFIIAINALGDAAGYYKIVAQKKRPLRSISKRIEYYKKVISCYVLMSRLSLTIKDIPVAAHYANKALEAFESYVILQMEILPVEVRKTFWDLYGAGPVDFPQPVWFEGKKEELWHLKGVYHTTSDEVVYTKLAEEKLNREREILLKTLQSALPLIRI